VPEADVSQGDGGIDGPARTAQVDRRRAIIGMVVLVVVISAAGFAIYRERHSFADTLERVGVWWMLASFVLALGGVGATYPLWRSVLGGLGVKLPWGSGARLFFVSQLGKYLPGSVWPVLMQMEAGRSQGAGRRTMLGANLITIVLSCSVGLVVACLLLPLYDAAALTHYWWALLALPLLIGMLHPRALPFLLDRVFVLLRRPPLGERLEPGAEFQAAGWSVVSWLGQGGQVFLLCAALGHHGLSTLVLCIGGMALAVSLGVLFIPAPAGAGVRDIVLKLVLGVTLTSGQALAVVIASRVVLIASDVVLAGGGALLGRMWKPRRVAHTPR
jgi:glycosyltransferase 2 family protein